MAIANLANVPVDAATQAEWSFSHAAHHRDIIDAIRARSGQDLQLFALDPFNPDNSSVWLEQHQQMHNAQNAVLGIAGNDLLDVDWKDQGERESWIWLNFVEHQLAGNELEIG